MINPSTLPMRFFTGMMFASFAAAFSITTAHAGHAVLEAKETVPPEPPYEAGRGLITLEGPSGMFINPTSATLPKGAFTVQYCIFFPEDSTELVGNGLMAGYGVTDWLEIGGVANLVAFEDFNEIDDKSVAVGGPYVRVRLLKDHGWIPQLSVGAYAKWGTHALNQVSTFVAAYKRIPIDEQGFVKSLGLHAGFRGTWFDEDVREPNSFIGYCGAELQFPYRFYLVGEVSTKGNDPGGQQKRTPYAFGLQWRLKGVNVSLAGIQPGGTKDIGLYSGVALNLGF